MRDAAYRLAGMLVLLAGCFDPQLGERPFRCGARSACPADYRCGDDGVCVRGAVSPRADARVVDGPTSVADAASAPDAAGPLCSAGCGPETCAGLSCGRSPCGYPCGDCPPTALAVPCLDHYGEMVDEGSPGLRTCVADPTRLEVCTCSGGSATSWIGCAGGCFAAGCSRSGQIGCGFASCGPGQVCCRQGRDSSCTSGDCGDAPTATCDGPEDCPGGLCCGGEMADSARCVAGSSCEPFVTRCHTTADCPVTEPLCCSTGPTSGVKACFATPQDFGCG